MNGHQMINCPRRVTQFVPIHSICVHLLSSYPLIQLVPIDFGHHAAGSGSACCLSVQVFHAHVWLVQARKTARSHGTSASFHEGLVARHDNTCNCIEFHDHARFFLVSGA